MYAKGAYANLRHRVLHPGLSRKAQMAQREKRKTVKGENIKVLTQVQHSSRSSFFLHVSDMHLEVYNTAIFLNI